jgi:hypothetical protein
LKKVELRKRKRSKCKNKKWQKKWESVCMQKTF